MNSKIKQKKTLLVDQEQCVGCQSCVDFYQDLFEMKGDKAVFIGQNKLSKSSVSEAISVCPVEAIKLNSDEAK
jgi:ferredoxin